MLPMTSYVVERGDFMRSVASEDGMEPDLQALELIVFAAWAEIYRATKSGRLERTGKVSELLSKLNDVGISFAEVRDEVKS